MVLVRSFLCYPSSPISTLSAYLSIHQPMLDFYPALLVDVDLQVAEFHEGSLLFRVLEYQIIRVLEYAHRVLFDIHEYVIRKVILLY